LHLGRDWSIGQRIGGGGFGQVYRAVSDEGIERALKLVPKVSGAERELLLAEMGDARNVIPVLETGETDDAWVLVMPLADMSLRDYIDSESDEVRRRETVTILLDVCHALADLSGRVVHRDIKPENILRLNGSWCLADFGIARYAEASTATDTRKSALSMPYAAPERWLHERADQSTDLYSLGIVAFEVITGRRPFSGPTEEDFREQHLQGAVPTFPQASPALSAAVRECLLKSSAARPTAVNMVTRLERELASTSTRRLTKLEAVNQSIVEERAEMERLQSIARSESEQRTALFRACREDIQTISAALLEEIVAAAPSARVPQSDRERWVLELGPSTLTFSELTPAHPNHDRVAGVPFDVLASAAILLSAQGQDGYRGRAHSLWYCDAQEQGRYGWFETAFMRTFPDSSQPISPFSLTPGEESAGALSVAMTPFQVAWPFSPLSHVDLDEFIVRWAEWLGDAAAGGLRAPASLPERDVRGSWRRE